MGHRIYTVDVERSLMSIGFSHDATPAINLQGRRASLQGTDHVSEDLSAVAISPISNKRVHRQALLNVCQIIHAGCENVSNASFILYWSPLLAVV